MSSPRSPRSALDESVPPLHHPDAREHVTTVDTWELRVFATESLFRVYLPPDLASHVQLWHPARQVSILTPCLLTQHRYEIWTAEIGIARVPDLAGLASWLARATGLPAPDPTESGRLVRWLTGRGADRVAN